MAVLDKQALGIDAFAQWQSRGRCSSTTAIPPAANVWAIEFEGRTFACELRGPYRFFRIDFDLARAVAPLPPPWNSR